VKIWLFTAHQYCSDTDDNSILHQVFENKLIISRLCPTTSLNPSYCAFYICGNLKGKVYKNNPHTTEALQNEETSVMASDLEDELQNVLQDMLEGKRGSLPPVLIKYGKQHISISIEHSVVPSSPISLALLSFQMLFV
jgi:hypothetical protein